MINTATSMIDKIADAKIMILRTPLRSDFKHPTFLGQVFASWILNRYLPRKISWGEARRRVIADAVRFALYWGFIQGPIERFLGGDRQVNCPKIGLFGP